MAYVSFSAVQFGTCVGNPGACVGTPEWSRVTLGRDLTRLGPSGGAGAAQTGPQRRKPGSQGPKGGSRGAFGPFEGLEARPESQF